MPHFQRREGEGAVARYHPPVLPGLLVRVRKDLTGYGYKYPAWSGCFILVSRLLRRKDEGAVTTQRPPALPCPVREGKERRTGYRYKDLAVKGCWTPVSDLVRREGEGTIANTIRMPDLAFFAREETGATSHSYVCVANQDRGRCRTALPPAELC